MRQACTLVAVLMVCLSAAAEEPAAGPAAGGPLELTLARALQMGAEANLGLEERSYDAPIAWQGRIAADSVFDTLLTAGVAAGHAERPVTSVFLGAGTLQEDTVSAQAGLTRLLRSGGSVSLLYRADRLNSNSPFATVNPAITNGFSIEASHPLLRGAGDVALADVRRAQNNVVAAKAGYRSAVEATLLLVAEAYWELVFADTTLDARRKSEQVARELLQDAQSRLSAEVGTPLDVAEARAGVERRRSEVLQAENFRETVEDRLLALILPFGREVRAAVHVVPLDAPAAGADSLPSRADERRYVELAMQGRAELLALKADLANAGIDVRVASDAIRPQLDVVGRVGTDGLDTVWGSSFEDLVRGRAASGSVGLQFSMFLGQRGARASWLAAAWRRRHALVRERDLENFIVVDVRAALRDLDTARGQIQAGRAEVEAAEEDVRGEGLRLTHGKSTPFRVLQKEDDLTTARTRLGRALADLSLAEARLHRAVGTLAERYGIDASRWEDCRGCR
ncbi:MAG: TolC family protein [Planctomycetota bacterium]|nr:TolC family protein [Planctomycetota bacterium]